MTRIVRRREQNQPIEITENYPVETIGTFDGSLIEGVSLISHVPHSKKAFEEAHKQGIKVIPYLHFTDIHSFYADQDVFLFQHPEILLIDADGKWVHIPMDGSDRLFRFLTCANSPSYWKLSLAYVKKMMDWGADGVFVGGCHLADCHYDSGNYKWRRRAIFLEELLPELGIEPERFKFEWISASEGEKFQKTMAEVYSTVKSLGPLKLKNELNKE
jgi:coenzyme F420-reducing hydrogenase delta subunit